MQAIRILALSFRQIFHARGQILRIIAVPGLIMILLAALQPGQALHHGEKDLVRMLAVLKMLLGSILYCWIAVNIHRHVLTGESFSLLPEFKWPLFWRYGLAAILIGGLLMVLASLITLTLNLLFSIGNRGIATYTLGRILVAFIVMCLSLRLIAPLPALAVGKSYASGFRRLRGTFPTLVLLCFMNFANAILLILVIGKSTEIIGPNAPRPARYVILWGGIAIGTAIQIASNLFEISLITAIYRHYQGRPED